MAKVYRIFIEAQDEDTGEKEILEDDLYTGFTLLGDCYEDDKMCEMMAHDTIMNLAKKLAQGSKTRFAARIANIILEMKKSALGDIEELLINSIGGNDDE